MHDGGDQQVEPKQYWSVIAQLVPVREFKEQGAHHWRIVLIGFPPSALLI